MRGLVAALCVLLGMPANAQQASDGVAKGFSNKGGNTTHTNAVAPVAPLSAPVTAVSQDPPPVSARVTPIPAVRAAAPPPQPIAVVSPPPAAAAPAPASAPAPSTASGTSFSPMVVASLIAKVCLASEGDGAGVASLATSAGYGVPTDPPPALKRVLPDSARAWSVPAMEASVYLFAYGEEPHRCGAAIVRALPDVTAQRVVEQLGAATPGFRTERAEALSPETKFTRLKSASGRFIDMMEYSANGSDPAVVRLDLLPE